MTFEQVCKALTRDPWHLTIADIAELTPYQVRNIYFRSDERDQPVPFYAQAKDFFWKVNLDRGMSEAQIVELWREEVKRNPALMSA